MMDTLLLPAPRFVTLIFVVFLSALYKPGRGLMGRSSLSGWAINCSL